MANHKIPLLIVTLTISNLAMTSDPAAHCIDPDFGTANNKVLATLPILVKQYGYIPKVLDRDEAELTRHIIELNKTEQCHSQELDADTKKYIERYKQAVTDNNIKYKDDLLGVIFVTNLQRALLY